MVEPNYAGEGTEWARGIHPSGTMEIVQLVSMLPGFESDSEGTWQINYSMSSGTITIDGPVEVEYEVDGWGVVTEKENRTSVTKAYSGESMSAYLPINSAGNEVLALL